MCTSEKTVHTDETFTDETFFTVQKTDDTFIHNGKKFKNSKEETILGVIRGGSRPAATSKMERFVIIVNGFQPLTIITKRSILDVAAVLDPPLVIIDNKLAFDSHTNRMCNKACQRLSEPSRISAFIDLNKREILFQSMIKSQLSYCPLICIFCSRKSNNLINRIHERISEQTPMTKIATLKIC